MPAASRSLVTRDRDGVLRAFLNVCRHRGAVLADGCGTRSTIQCPYHAWTYDLDGALRNAPRSEREPAFEPGECRSRRRASARGGRSCSSTRTRCAAARGAPRRPAGDPRARHRRRRARLPLARRVRRGRELEGRRRELPRVLPLPDRAPGVLRRRRRAPGPLRARAACDVRRAVLRAEGDRRCRAVPSALPEHGDQRLPRPRATSRSARSPARAVSHRAFLDYFFAAGATPEWLAEFLEFDDQVGREDTALVEGVQRGMAAGLIAGGG